MLESSREPADQLAGRFLRERRYLGSRDRRFISELYFDILRNRALLEFHARTDQGAEIEVAAGIGIHFENRTGTGSTP